MWPGQDNVHEYVSEDEQGNVHMRSVDDYGEIVLAKNAFQFTVNYLY